VITAVIFYAPLFASILGFYAGLVLFAAVLGQSLWKHPSLLSPQEYQIERIKAHPVGVGEFPPDVAWPNYIFKQAGIDRHLVRVNLGKQYRRFWRWPRDTFVLGKHGNRFWWWAILPVSLSVMGFMLVGGAVAWACYWVYWAVVTSIMTVNGSIAGALRSYLHAAETRRRETRHAHASCMNCFHVTPWPAYRCPGCSMLHQDVRPGRLGLFFRRCECGYRFPVGASRTGWRLTAVCKRCGEPLAEGAGAIRDIRVPIFGDTSAGKTRFLYASLNSVLLSAKEAGIPAAFPDESSLEHADLGFDIIRSGQDTGKTSATVPVSVSCRLGTGRGSDLIHLFDAAGEHFRDAQRYDSLRFLDDGQALVYVLDPFSIGEVRARLAGYNATVIRDAHAAAGDPEIAYGEVVSRLRDGGVPAGSQLLAIVISKSDLLRAAGLNLPSDSAEIAEWLTEVGQHNIVMSARREFAEVRYFTVASQNVTPDRLDDPAAPLHWLLTAHGVRLPTYSAALSPPSGASRQTAGTSS
jgi:hypothetical protein